MLGSPPHIQELSTVNLELFELIKKVDLQYPTTLILCEPLLSLQVQINIWLSNSMRLRDSSFLAVSEKFFFVSFFLVSRKFVVDWSGFEHRQLLVFWFREASED